MFLKAVLTVMTLSMPVSVLAAKAPAKAAKMAAKTCKLEISGNDQMQYDKKELTIASDCTQVELTLKHTGKLAKNIMGHNWVLTTPAHKDEVLKSAEKSGPAKEYEPTVKDVIAKTKLVGGGESASVTFSTKGLKKGGDYIYMCTMPGHAALMNGKFIIK